MNLCIIALLIPQTYINITVPVSAAAASPTTQYADWPQPISSKSPYFYYSIEYSSSHTSSIPPSSSRTARPEDSALSIASRSWY